ncbi:MAG: N-acetyltransferase, partial [Planctomycetota bacterium]
MSVRRATVADARAICELVNSYAERGLMLHRSLEGVYASLRDFHVAVEQDRVVGCVAVRVFWSDLAEIKSLAVASTHRRKGLGRTLVETAVADARLLGVQKLFALTYEPEFFERMGFTRMDRDALPEKIWRECIACPKVDACDEIAMLRTLDTP